ncbi:MAG TPA: flagellar hook capping FlgD N-terminal domain-containing protein [Pirellulales bacterium]|nr:flagellar hook capping FlgD N-terminal domain-containing protein [Pirellulales bacterium]
MSTSGVNNNGATTQTSSSSSSTGSSADAWNSISPDDFLKMLITELQNQDPTNPTDSSQILQQISEIRNIQATSDLTTTLNQVLLEQTFSAASVLVGKSVQGMADDGTSVAGTVDSVTFGNGTATLNVGQQTLKLGNVQQINNS